MHINIPAVLIANGIGIAILFVVAVGNKWRFMDALKERKYLSIILVACAVNCIVDPLCFIADGKPGFFNRFLVIGCNTALYFCGMIIASLWVYVVASHLDASLHRAHHWFINIVLVATTVSLILNLFVPILFAVDGNNVYIRMPGYWAFTIAYAVFMIDGLLIYIRRRRESGKLKFFPVWAFLIPAVVGTAIQTLFYGISTATPGITVSIVCVILCLQNEFILRDKLTGLYNRFYLNSVEKLLRSYPRLQYSAIMMDINSFKSINDNYGHKTGDEALIRTASILMKVSGRIGEVVRYAGDEFIIVLNTQDEYVIKDLIDNIHLLMEDFNNSGVAPYKLSVSTGYAPINLMESSMDGFIDKIDKLMYEDKEAYYKASGHTPPHAIK